MIKTYPVVVDGELFEVVAQVDMDNNFQIIAMDPNKEFPTAREACAFGVRLAEAVVDQHLGLEKENLQ